MSQTPEKSLSHLELKIARSYRSTRTNDLRVKNSDSSSSGHFSVSKGLSIAHFMQELSEGNESSRSSSEEVNLFQTAVERGGTLELPPGLFIVRNLLCNERVVLKSGGGSVVEVTGGVVVKNKLVLSGVEVAFKGGGNVLFRVEGELEVADCRIHSGGLGGEVCFAAGVKSVVTVGSTRISGFAGVIRASCNSSVFIEKCCIENSGGTALSVVNPQEFIVKGSYLSNSGRSAVNVKLNKSHKTVKTVTSADSTVKTRTIDIVANEFNGTQGKCIRIHGETRTFFPINIIIRENYISRNGQEGIFIKHLSVKDLAIKGNTIERSRKTCCWLQRVHTNQEHVDITENKFSSSCSGYGLYLYGTSALITGTECSNNKLGGLLAVGRSAPVHLTLTISHSKFTNNGENGVNLLQFLAGTLTLERVKICENEGNGIYGSCSTENKCIGSIVIVSQCKITGNAGHAITSYKVPFKLNNSELGTVSLDPSAKRSSKLTPNRESCTII